MEPMFDESEGSWRAFFQKLKKRGLRRVGLCISDAHAGIQTAVKKEILGTSWQRCRSRVTGIFPTIDSWVRLETCYLIEYSDDWPTDRSYIKREKIQTHRA